MTEFERIDGMDAELKAELFRAVTAYVLDGLLPVLSPSGAVAFTYIEPELLKRLKPRKLKPKEQTERRTGHGTYKNVFLSGEEYEKLKQEYPRSLETYIEKISSYKAKTGRTYSRDAAALRDWITRDGAEVKTSNQSFDNDDFLNTALKRSYAK